MTKIRRKRKAGNTYAYNGNVMSESATLSTLPSCGMCSLCNLYVIIISRGAYAYKYLPRTQCLQCVLSDD